MPKDKNGHEIDLNKYEDLEGLTIKKMNFGLWLSEHRAKITKVIIILLIAISAFFFIYSSYGYIVYFLSGSSEKNANISGSGVVSQRNVTVEIAASSPAAFRSGEKYDLVVRLKNPNDKFSGHFQYCFAAAGQDVACGSSFILPSEEKYIFALGQDIAAATPAISFRITSTSWQRIDGHKITDWNDFNARRLNFIFENISLATAGKSGLSEKVGLDSLEFTVVNRTDFGYYEAPLNIAFYNGSELIGVNRYIVKDFLAGESRSVRLSWPGGLSGNVRTEIRPEIDILDDNAYMRYQGNK